MLLRIFCVFVFVSNCAELFECKRQLPSFVKVCHRSDPERKQCMKSSMEALKPYLAKGIPSMRIPVLDPLHITAFDFSQDNIKVVCRDWDVEAMHEFTIDNFDADFDSNKCFLSVDVRYPQLITRGDYDLEGQFYLIQLDGRGRISVNLTSVQSSVKMDCKLVTREQKEYVEFTDIDMTVKVDDIRVDMINLFKGNPEMVKNAIMVFNENSKKISKEFEGTVNTVIGEMALAMMRDVFRSFPLDVLAPL